MTDSRQDALIRQLQGAMNGLAFRAGHVTSAGAVDLGEGVTAVKNSTGDYTLTFDPPFQTAARVVAMQGQGSSQCTIKQKAATSSTVSTFPIVSVNLSGSLADSDFWFIACG